MAKRNYECVRAWRIKNPEEWKKAKRENELRNPLTVKARRKRYRAKHALEIKAKRDSMKLDINLFIDEYKASMGCCYCATNVPAVLDFHHLRDKEETISVLKRSAWKTDKLMAEMSKCVVLCANCHRMLHAGLISL